MISSGNEKQGNSATSTFHGQEGQSFFEFVLLLLIVMMISTVMIGGFRSGVRGYWRGAAFLLCTHGQTINAIKDECNVINN